MDKNEILEQIINDAAESADVLHASMQRLAGSIEEAASTIAAAIQSGGKVLACGNGGSAADAQHLAAELVGRFLREREAYAAIALTTDTSIITSIGNDYGYDAIFERQVEALGEVGDVLVAISTSGNSPNVIKAMGVAREKGMIIVALTGKGGGQMAEADILLDAESDCTPRIQEMHGFAVHVLCDIVEQILTTSELE